MDFVTFSKGEHISYFDRMPDGYILDWQDAGGLFCFALLNNPSPMECDCILYHSSPFEVAFTELNNCGFFGLKFDIMPWGDCTFEPRFFLDSNIPSCDNPHESLNFNIVLIDPARGGLIKGIRVIPLGHDFSRKFAKWCDIKAKSTTDFTRNKHIEAVDKIRSQMSSEEIANQSLFRWKL